MKLSSNVVSCTTGADESRHLYPKVKLNNEANEYTFDEALINWYNNHANNKNLLRSYVGKFPVRD